MKTTEVLLYTKCNKLNISNVCIVYIGCFNSFHKITICSPKIYYFNYFNCRCRINYNIVHSLKPFSIYYMVGTHQSST